MGASLKTGGGGGGGRRRRRRGHAPMSEINVTPFVDVMLVLLIIFMVAAPLLTAGVPVDLPEAKGQTLATESKEPVVLTITKDAKIYFGQEEKPENTIRLEDLGTRLAAVFQARGVKDDTIYVRGDALAQHGFFTQVLDRIHQSGFRKVSVVIKSVDGKG